MTQGPLERIATALEDIAAALTGPATATARARPQRPDAAFEWEPDTTFTAPLPEPAPPEERCGFLVERFIHPLDRTSVIYQVSKDGVYDRLTEREAKVFAALDDEQFTAAMATKLARVAAEREGLMDGDDDGEELSAEAIEALEDIRESALSDDERRQREWAAQIRANHD